jgi:hypothetical protein
MFLVGIFDNAFLAALHNRLCKKKKTLLSVNFKQYFGKNAGG